MNLQHKAHISEMTYSHQHRRKTNDMTLFHHGLGKHSPWRPLAQVEIQWMLILILREIGLHLQALVVPKHVH
jgi:hypothetical protein